jgi:thymidylate synthase
MHLKTRNVNTAFRTLVELFHEGDKRNPWEHSLVSVVEMPSRYGEVMMVEEPVIVTYEKPCERVLLNRERDANPFFHLYESLWMLAGRNDLAPLAYYNSRMREFSDDGQTLNGAYGYRWRHASNLSSQLRSGTTDLGTRLAVQGIGATEVDQLSLVIEHLRSNPYSRRAVLQMWTVEEDLLNIGSSKDVCCNLSVMFSVGLGICRACDGRGWHTKSTMPRTADGVHYPSEYRRDTCPFCKGKPHEQPRYLNMTVTNRSNDLIWGMIGANAVQFSILQEYVAAHLGLEVGVYNQFTNNLHIYTDRWQAEKWLQPQETDGWYERAQAYTLVPLIRSPQVFDEELPLLLEAFKGEPRGPWTEIAQVQSRRDIVDDLQEPFFRNVAAPMFRAFELYKLDKKTTSALRMCELIQSDDWLIASSNWLHARRNK